MATAATPAAAVRHARCELRTGVSMHYVEAVPASGGWSTTLLLVHGFPDTWYGWRHQISAVAAAGYRVLAPDMRGYGETTPIGKDPAWYCMENTTADLVALLDALLLDKVVICGHDWGGTCVWNFCLHHRERVSGVIAVCTPFFAWKNDNPWVKMQANPGRFDYQLYFQTDEAQREFERDLPRTVRCMIRGASAADIAATGAHATTPWVPTKDGGAMAKIPKDVTRSTILSAADEEYYAWQFSRSGFFGPLSWYRNVERNWRWNARTEGQHVNVPCLMICAAKDATLPPSMAKGMPEWIGDLRIEVVTDAGHWVLQEQPAEVNGLLIQWLGKRFPAGRAAL
mmetsp:Transcript_11639/g.32961  ORF Transcript_11639/g.32961 Transcript_11639/m.32961 type:complete len:341 (+) Transcript_11639:53-1075(+)